MRQQSHASHEAGRALPRTYATTQPAPLPSKPPTPKYSYLEYSRNEYILARMDIKKTIYSDQYKTIIQNLKEARLSQGLTQLEVAKHFGVGQSFISKIESGQYRLDILQLQELAKLYQKPLTSFLKEK